MLKQHRQLTTLVTGIEELSPVEAGTISPEQVDQPISLIARDVRIRQSMVLDISGSGSEGPCFLPMVHEGAPWPRSPALLSPLLSCPTQSSRLSAWTVGKLRYVRP